MAMIKTNINNYNYVTFETLKGSYSMTRKNYLKFKTRKYNVKYFIINND